MADQGDFHPNFVDDRLSQTAVSYATPASVIRSTRKSIVKSQLIRQKVPAFRRNDNADRQCLKRAAGAQ